MSKKKNVYEFTDLLYHAVDLGYEWNVAHNHLDHCRPSYELKSYDIDDYDEWVTEQENIKTIRIISSFMIKERIRTLTIV